MSGFGVDRSSVASGSGASASSIPESIIDAKGDLIAGASADTPTKVPVGTNEQRLVADSTQGGGLAWKSDTTNYAITAKGELLVGTAADTLAPITVGAAGEVLMPASGATPGVAWLKFPPAGAYLINGKISRSVAAGALTLAVKTLADADPSTSSPVYVLMPTATSNVLDGGYTIRSITGALSMVVSSGSTLGHTSAVASPVMVYLIDNAGTLELAASAKFFGGASVQTTTAEGGAGAADSATVLYSTTLRSNVVAVCVQSWESTQSTAGTWAATTGQVLPYPFQARARGTEGQVLVSKPAQADGLIWTDYTRQPLNVNPNWLIDQINEGVATIAATAQGPDGWSSAITGAGGFTMQQVADPDNAALKCMKIACTTADAAIAAGDLYQVYTAVEGYDAAALMAGTASASSVTIQFKFKTNVTGVYGIGIKNSAANRSYVGIITVPDTNENAYSVTLTLDTSGTWLYTNGGGLYVSLTLAGGSTFQTTSGSWQAGEYYTTAAQANFMSANTNVAYLKRFHVIPGGVALAYANHDIQKELAKAQRYYAKSWLLGTAALTATAVNQYDSYAAGDSSTTTQVFPVSFASEMRAVPTAASYSPATVATNTLRDGTGAADVAASVSATTRGLIVKSSAGGLVANDVVQFHWTANARLS